MSALGHRQTFAPQNVMAALPPMRLRKRIPANGHVRFTPESGHVQCKMTCPLWANSGHCVSAPSIQQHEAAAGTATTGLFPVWIADLGRWRFVDNLRHVIAVGLLSQAQVRF